MKVLSLKCSTECSTKLDTTLSSLLDLDYQNPEDYDDIPDESTLTRWIEKAYQLDKAYTVSIRIVASEEAEALNKQYRNKDYATNILSFPFDPPPIPMEIVHLGDLVLCKEVVEKEALEQHKAIGDHWAHMIIHGILHLQGYDHISETDANEMESLEISLLEDLGVTNPYLISKPL